MDVLELKDIKPNIRSSSSMHYITSAKVPRRRPLKESFCEFDIIETHRRAHRSKNKNSDLMQKIEDIANRNVQIEMLYNNGLKKEISSDKPKYANSESNKSPNRNYVTCVTPDQKERKSRSAIRKERRKLLNEEVQTQSELSEEINKVTEIKTNLERELKERKSRTPMLNKIKHSSKETHDKLELSSDKSIHVPTSSICQNCYGQITNSIKEHSCDSSPRKVKRKTRKKRSALNDKNKINKIPSKQKSDDTKEIKKIITVFENTKAFESDSIISKEISQLTKIDKIKNKKKKSDDKKLFSFFGGKKKKVDDNLEVTQVTVALSPIEIVAEPAVQTVEVKEVVKKPESEHVIEHSFELDSTFGLKPTVNNEKNRKHVKIKKKKISEDAYEKVKSSRKELSFSNLNLTPIIYLDIKQPISATTQTSKLMLIESKTRNRSVSPTLNLKKERLHRNRSCEPLSKTTIALRDLHKVAEVEKAPYSFNIDKFKKRTSSLPPPENVYPIMAELITKPERETLHSKIGNNNKFRSCKVPAPNHRIVEISSKTFGDQKVSFTVEGCEPPKKLHLGLSSSKIAKMNANLSTQVFNGTEVCKSDLTILNHSPKRNKVLMSADSLEVSKIDTIILMNKEEVKNFASTSSSMQSPRSFKKYKGYVVKKDSPKKKPPKVKKIPPMPSKPCWSKTTNDSSTQTIPANDDFKVSPTTVNYMTPMDTSKLPSVNKCKDVAVLVDLDTSPECNICKNRRQDVHDFNVKTSPVNFNKKTDSVATKNNSTNFNSDVITEKKLKQPEEPSRASNAISEVLQNVNFVDYLTNSGSKPKIKHSKSVTTIKKESLKSLHASSDMCVAVSSIEAPNNDNKKNSKKLKDNLSRIPRPQNSRRQSPSPVNKNIIEEIKTNNVEVNASIFPQNEFIALEKCLKVILDKITTTLTNNDIIPPTNNKSIMNQSVENFAKDIKFKCAITNNTICNICSEKLHLNNGIGSKYRRVDTKNSYSLDNIFKKRIETPPIRSVYKNQKGFISSVSSLSSISDYFYVPTLKHTSYSTGKETSISTLYSQYKWKIKTTNNSIKKKKSKNFAVELKKLIKNSSTESSSISRVVILSVSSSCTFYSPSSYINKIQKQLIIEKAIVNNSLVTKSSVFKVFPKDRKVISKEPFFIKKDINSSTTYTDSLELLGFQTPDLCPLTDIFNFSPPNYAYHVYNTEVINKPKKDDKKIDDKDKEIFDKLIFGHSSSNWSNDKVMLTSPTSKDLEEYRKVIFGSTSKIGDQKISKDSEKTDWDFKMDEYRKHIFDNSTTKLDEKKSNLDNISEWDLRMREYRKHIFDQTPDNNIEEEAERKSSFSNNAFGSVTNHHKRFNKKESIRKTDFANINNTTNNEESNRLFANAYNDTNRFNSSGKEELIRKTTFNEVLSETKKKSSFDLNYVDKKNSKLEEDRKITFTPSVIKIDDQKLKSADKLNPLISSSIHDYKNKLSNMSRNEQLNSFYDKYENDIIPKKRLHELQIPHLLDEEINFEVSKMSVNIDYIKAPEHHKKHDKTKNYSNSCEDDSLRWASGKSTYVTQNDDSLKSIPSIKQNNQEYSIKDLYDGVNNTYNKYYTNPSRTSGYDTTIDDSESDMRLDYSNYKRNYTSFNQSIDLNELKKAISERHNNVTVGDNFKCVFSTSIKKNSRNASQRTSCSDVSMEHDGPTCTESKISQINQKSKEERSKTNEANARNYFKNNLRNFDRYNKRISFPKSTEPNYDSDVSTDRNSVRSITSDNKTSFMAATNINTSIYFNEIVKPKSGRKVKQEQETNTSIMDLGNFSDSQNVCKNLIINYKTKGSPPHTPIPVKKIPIEPSFKFSESDSTIKNILDENGYESCKTIKPNSIKSFFKKGSNLLDIFKVKTRQHVTQKNSSSSTKSESSCGTSPVQASKTVLWFNLQKKKQPTIDVECEAICPNKKNKNQQTCKQSCQKEAIRKGYTNKRIITDPEISKNKASCTCEHEADMIKCKNISEAITRKGSRIDLLERNRNNCKCIQKSEEEVEMHDYGSVKSISSKQSRQHLTDKEIFDKLLNKFEKHDSISKRLSNDDNFFDEQLKSVNHQAPNQVNSDEDIGSFSTEDKYRTPRFTNKPKAVVNKADCDVNADDIGTCFARGFRPDNLMLSGDACFNLNKQDRIKMSPHMLKNTESTIDFSERETPLDFLLALGFMVDEASNALKDDDIRSRLLAAITEARVWINKITTTQGTLLYLVAYKSRPDTMRYFLQLVEAIINKRITNAIKLDGFLRVLEQVEDGRIQMINILGDDKFEEEENEEKIVKKQLKHLFINVYNIAEKEVKDRDEDLTNNQVSLLRILVAKYRAGLHPHLELIARYIGQTLLNTEIQLEAAMIFLSRLDTAEVKLKEFENYCGIVCEMDKLSH